MSTPSVEHKSVQELAAALEAGALLIDVRSPGEFASGHVPGARSLPLGELPAGMETLAPGPVWVICRSGARSARAAAALHAAGREAINVSGGTLAWRRAGYPVEPPDAAPGWRSLLFPALACLTLGLAPLSPVPHVVGKLRWVAGGAVGMGAMDWLDLVMHGAPWGWLLVALARQLKPR